MGRRPQRKPPSQDDPDGVALGLVWERSRVRGGTAEPYTESLGLDPLVQDRVHYVHGGMDMNDMKPRWIYT